MVMSTTAASRRKEAAMVKTILLAAALILAVLAVGFVLSLVLFYAATDGKSWEQMSYTERKEVVKRLKAMRNGCIHYYHNDGGQLL